MNRKTVPLTGIKTAGLAEGQFEGWASTFGNVDSAGDRVMPGAFAKSIQSGRVVPLNWEHRGTVDPRCMVGQVVTAEEVPEGLHITGQFDTDSEFGQAAYRAVKARRVGALSIGYIINQQTKAVDGVNELVDLDLIEVSVVSRPANDHAVVTSVKSVGPAATAELRTRLARAQVTTRGETMQDKGNSAEERYVKGRDEQVEYARVIVEAAAALERDLTEPEAEQVAKHLAEADRLTKAIAGSHRSHALMDRLNEMVPKEATYRAGELVREPLPATAEHVALTGTHAKALATNIIDKMPRDQMGTKALAAGQQTTSIIMLPDVVPTGRPAQSILDLLPSRQVTPSYMWLRQSARDLQAAPVAAGDAKPISDVSVTAQQGRLQVIAHITSQIDKFLVGDSNSLQRFIIDEMLWGLRKAIESEVLSGDGTGEHMLGILNTSGIMVQAFATNALTSVRKALTILDSQGYVPGAVVLRSLDWESIELLESTSGATDVRGVPIDPVQRRLWGVSVALSDTLPAKVGLVIGENAVSVDTDGHIAVDWSSAVGDDFSRNAVRCRVETRANVSVAQPGAVVKVSTAA